MNISSSRPLIERKNAYAVTAVGVAAVKIHTGTGKPGKVIITNVGGASMTEVFLAWDNALTTASYGIPLVAPASVSAPGGSVELPAANDIWAIGSGASGAVSVMSTVG